MSAKKCIQAYRTILKHFKTLPTISNKDNVIRNSVIERFRIDRHETDSKKIKSMRELANGYALMVSSNSELNYLLSLDTGATLNESEKVANTAEKLGFIMPAIASD